MPRTTKDNFTRGASGQGNHPGVLETAKRVEFNRIVIVEGGRGSQEDLRGPVTAMRLTGYGTTFAAATKELLETLEGQEQLLLDVLVAASKDLTLNDVLELHKLCRTSPDLIRRALALLLTGQLQAGIRASVILAAETASTPEPPPGVPDDSSGYDFTRVPF